MHCARSCTTIAPAPRRRTEVPATTQPRTQLGLLPQEWPDLERPSDLEPPKRRGARSSAAVSPKSGSKPEELFAAQCRAYRLPRFDQQLLFAKAALGRQWRFDFAFPDFKLAVEINGVNVQRLGGRLVVLGRHASIEGIRGDNEKTRAAIRLGWSVLPFLQTDVKPELAINETMRELAARGWKGFAHANNTSS